MKVGPSFVAVLLSMSMIGCGGLILPPGAEKFYSQAKGADGIETALNLVRMMEGSVEQAKLEPAGGVESLADLHAQFHVLHRAFDEMTDTQTATFSYLKAVTIRRGMVTIWYRLSDSRLDQTLRNQHLDLFAVRLVELRRALLAIQTEAREMRTLSYLSLCSMPPRNKKSRGCPQPSSRRHGRCSIVRVQPLLKFRCDALCPARNEPQLREP
jgi:hypothetical protein